MDSAPTGPALRRAAAAASIGTLLEYYDYYLFGLAAGTVFPKLFFPSDNALASHLSSFATFAVGFALRPIGGVLFGHIGDRVGRKPALVLTILCMGIATFLIGVLPAEHRIGVWAPILLVLLRLVQGASVGGEMGGAASLAVEYAPRERRGFYGALLISGAGIALVGASGLMFAFSSLPEHEFLSWGWRVPFWFSAVLMLIGLLLRSRIAETPVFEQSRRARPARPARTPLVAVLRRPRMLYLVVTFSMVGGVAGYALTTYGPSYLKDHGVSSRVAFLATMVAGALEIVVAPLTGAASDRWGRRPVFLGAIVGACASAYPAFLLFDTGDTLLICLAMGVGFAVGSAAMSALAQTMMAEMFDTSERFTGINMGYQLCGVVGGGVAPFVATAIVAAAGGRPWPVAVYVVAVGLLSAVSVVLLPEGSQRELAAPA